MSVEDLFPCELRLGHYGVPLLFFSTSFTHGPVAQKLTDVELASRVSYLP